jgi:hypothetical protein
MPGVVPIALETLAPPLRSKIVSNRSAWINTDFELGVVRNGWLSTDSGNGDLKYAKVISFHFVRLSIPAVYRWVSSVFIAGEFRTEIANEIGSRCVWSPLPVYYVVVWEDLESKPLESLIKVSRSTELIGPDTLENLSRPPSDSSIVLIHACVFENRLRRASLNGPSHGSSVTTPVVISWLPQLRCGSSHRCHQLGSAQRVACLTQAFLRIISPIRLSKG